MSYKLRKAFDFYMGAVIVAIIFFLISFGIDMTRVTVSLELSLATRVLLMDSFLGLMGIIPAWLYCQWRSKYPKRPER